MSDLAKTGVDSLIDMVDSSGDKVFEAVSKFEDAAKEAGHGAIDIGDVAFDKFFEEMKELKDRLVDAMKTALHAVTEPLP